MADSRTLLIRSATVLTMNPARELIADGAVLVEAMVERAIALAGKP